MNFPIPIPPDEFPLENPHGKFHPVSELCPDTFEISVSVSFLGNLYIFGCWITGECDYSRVKFVQDLAFASKARH